MKSNDSPKIPDKGQTPDIPGLPSRLKTTKIVIFHTAKSVQNTCDTLRLFSAEFAELDLRPVSCSLPCVRHCLLQGVTIVDDLTRSSSQPVYTSAAVMIEIQFYIILVGASVIEQSHISCSSMRSHTGAYGKSYTGA